MAMSDEHKAALAKGRRQARAIRAYLEALGNRKPGRPVTRESLDAHLERIESRLATETDVLRRLDLFQQRTDVVEAVESVHDAGEFEELEKAFIENSKRYGLRKGIGYAAWRKAGVSAAVLRKAGVPQTRNRRSTSR